MRDPQKDVVGAGLLFRINLRNILKIVADALRASCVFVGTLRWPVLSCVSRRVDKYNSTSGVAQVGKKEKRAAE